MEEDVEEQRYLKLLKIEDIKVADLLHKLDSIQEFMLFNNKISQFYAGTDASMLEKIPGMKIMSRMQNSVAWFEKSNYFIKFIKYSINETIEILNSDTSTFVPFNVSEINEHEFYYVENAEYRLFSFCEILAQLYNDFLELNIPIHTINHRKFFQNNRKQIVNKIKSLKYSIEIKNVIIGEVDAIIKYLDEDCSYNYLVDKRNSFTHRENPHSFTMLNGISKSNFLVDHPLYEIKNIVEVLEKIYLYICTVYKLYFFEFKGYGLLDKYEIKVK